MKCEICSQEIEETFLGKSKGTVLKLRNGEKTVEHSVCNLCQKEFGEKIKERLGEK